MIDLVFIKTVVGLIKDLYGLLDSAKKSKRETFDRVLKPLYEKMEVGADEYYSAINETVLFIAEKKGTREQAIVKLKALRADLVVGRNALVGQILGLREQREGNKASRDDDEYNRLVEEFVSGIIRYFYEDDGASRISALVAKLVGALDNVDERQWNDSDLRFDFVRGGQSVLKTLERKWIEISATYTKLKLISEEL